MTIVVNSCVLVLIFCCSCIAVTSSDDVGVSGKLPESFANYIITAVLPDGESETRMRFGDILVRESSVTKQNGAGIRLVQRLTLSFVSFSYPNDRAIATHYTGILVRTWWQDKWRQSLFLLLLPTLHNQNCFGME